jgi:PAS domain S-box-containing protein
MGLRDWKYRLIGNQEEARNPDGAFFVSQRDAQPDRIATAIETNGAGQAQSPLPRLASVLEETPDFVGIADSAGNLLFINSAGRRMIGLEPTGALASMTLFDCQPEWACRIISQEGIPTALRNGFWSGETAAIGPDGAETPVSQVIVAHRNGDGQVEYLSTILRDITERKRAEMIQVRLRRQAAMRASVSVALAERDVPLREVLRQCSEDIVSHLDAALAQIWFFRPGERALEPMVEAEGRPIEFDAGWMTETTLPHSTNDAPNDQLIGNREWIQRSGIKALAAFPLKTEDGMIGALAVFARQAFEDDTLDELASLAAMIARGVERRRVDEELARSLAREREARVAAEEASRLKDDFLEVISHELRAPLTSILGWTQMLRAGGLDESSVARALNTIERNVAAQAHLVEELLDASRIATGKLRLEMRPLDLMSVVESAVDSVRPLIEEKRLRLQMVLEPWVGPFNGDQDRLKQIVWNLLTNAIKFTPPTGLIEVRLERLPEGREDKALLIVSDTGQGIDPEFLPRVFDLFRQADNSPTRKHCGLGLGLAIVKRLVELHGGAIYPYSRGLGQGSDFMITLPLATDQHAGNEAFHRQVQAGAGGKRASALGGARVLVVDDEYDTREVLGAMLSRYGAEVRAAESAAEAIRMLIEWAPDVLVSDVGLPGEDGYGLINKVRLLPEERGGAIPAIALTAYAGSQDRQRALSNGFQTHLAKPVEPVELARVVALAVGRDVKAIV